MAIPLLGVVIITAVVCGIIALISYHVKRQHLYRAAANLPGPPTLPIIGNVHYLLGDTVDIQNKMNAMIEKYPSPFRMWIGQNLLVIVYDADHVNTILLSNNAIEKNPVYKFARPWVGTGLITARGAKSKIHRKLIIPTFHKKILDTFVDIFNKQSVILTKQMRKELGKGEFDIFNYVSLCTLDIVCDTAMGVSVNAQTGNDTGYIDAVKRQSEIIYLRTFKPWLYSDFIFNLTNLAKDQRKCLQYLHGVTNDVISKKQNARNVADQMKNGTALPKQETTRKAFLDLMMELSNDGQKLTDVQIREEVDTMIVAANDTTATTASFVLLMLANFPEIQEKVYQELCNIFGGEMSSDEPISNEGLNQMDYLETVIKETMRIFPPAQMIGRILTGDIKIGDKILPKGSSVALPIIKLHRWEKYWSDPLKFDPDRFVPEEVAKRHPHCYIPFSGGPRGCIGQKYAFMSLKIILATILRRYVLTKDKPVKIQDIKLKANILLKTTEPITIKIVERSINPKNQV